MATVTGGAKIVGEITLSPNIVAVAGAVSDTYGLVAGAPGRQAQYRGTSEAAMRFKTNELTVSEGISRGGDRVRPEQCD